MPRYACPVCGDPGGYPIWIGSEPPDRCPHDDARWPQATSIKDVTQCEYAMTKARQRAEWRKALPDAFDDAGNMLPDRLADVLEAWAQMYPGQKVYL